VGKEREEHPPPGKKGKNWTLIARVGGGGVGAGKEGGKAVFCSLSYFGGGGKKKEKG